MPELPEVETVRRYLDRHLPGKTIASIDVLNSRNFVGNSVALVGKSIQSTGRLGKVLNLLLDDGTYLNIHLKMSGQLLYAADRDNTTFSVKIPLAESNRMPARTTRVIIYFTDRSVLFFNDLRKFGWVKHSPQPEGTRAPDVSRDEFSLQYFMAVVERSSKAIKTLLLDQDKLAGIGNIYANDALFLSRVHPFRIAKSLTNDEISTLYQAIREVIDRGLRYEGTSATDIYVIPDGRKGSYQNHFLVYSKTGTPCQVCGTPIAREKRNGRSSFYCPTCQK